MANQSLTGKDQVTTALHQLGSVEFLRSGAYCNLTDLAKPFGKRIDNWMRLKSTQELLQAFANDPAYGGESPIRIVQGGKISVPSDLRERSEIVQQGTFAHPDIAIAFAQWCSPAFQLWVSRQIRHLLQHGEVNLHYKEWSPDQFQRRLDMNRDNIKEMWS